VNTALVQVLGAVAYGEWKAYEGAKAEAEAATDPALRRRHRTVAAEELRHHKGFAARLEAMGADPDRAMRPYREVLDRYHARPERDPVESAVFNYLGEGVADDLLHWLRTVVDPDTAAFIDGVIEDEVGHEAAAAADLRAVLESTSDGHRRAGRAARRMVTHMLLTGRRGALPLFAFVRLGRPDALLGALLGGHARRMRAVGLAPFGLPVPRQLGTTAPRP
jgi:DNA-binding ferritin-like protein (Dps family)